MFTFKTPSSAPVSYLQADAKRLLRIIGKDENAAQGIVTAEQLPAAMTAIEQAIAREEEHQAEQQSKATQEEQEADSTQAASVSLRQRAMPLLRMFKAAQAEGDGVVWEA